MKILSTILIILGLLMLVGTAIFYLVVIIAASRLNLNYDDICPQCGGELELRDDGLRYCSNCDYSES